MLTKQDVIEISTLIDQSIDKKLDEKFDAFAILMKRQFDEIGNRFNIIDQKFIEIDNRFDVLEEKFDGSVSSTNKRFGVVEDDIRLIKRAMA